MGELQELAAEGGDGGFCCDGHGCMYVYTSGFCGWGRDGDRKGEKERVDGLLYQQ